MYIMYHHHVWYMENKYVWFRIRTYIGLLSCRVVRSSPGKIRLCRNCLVETLNTFIGAWLFTNLRAIKSARHFTREVQGSWTAFHSLERWEIHERVSNGKIWIIILILKRGPCLHELFFQPMYQCGNDKNI